MNKFICISSHALIVGKDSVIHGTGSALFDYLKSKNFDFYYIKHPIYGGRGTIVDSVISGLSKRIILKNKNSSFLPFQVLQEYFLTMKFINKRKKSIDLFIAIDPLNALYGILAKKQKKVKKVVFYTADYAIKRFDNPLLNSVYHLIDRFALKYADQVWNVSTRITKLRSKQGVEDFRNIFVPNSPAYFMIKRFSFNKINKHELVTVTTQASAVNFPAVFSMIKNLKKKYPDISLKVIGAGDWSNDFKPQLEKMKIEDNVTFIGPMSHEELLKLLAKAAIGLALYNDERSWAYFSDSMKARDFLACGLPVLVTENTSTADDIKSANAGYVVKNTEKNLTRVIDKIFTDQDLYQQFRKNALALAKSHDIINHLDKRFKNIGLSR